MSRIRLRRAHPAARVALGMVVAGLIAAGVPAQAESADTYASRAEYMANQNAAPAYPNPEYPNHKPLRGNYPGSYTSTASPPAQPPGSHFDWRAAAVGAAGMLGLILLLAAGRATARMARNRRRGIPFVVDVRDETPTPS
jgi:hypothetical protein